MEHDAVRNLILQEKLIVLFRKVEQQYVADLARALVRGGVKLLEVTFDQQAEDPAKTYKQAIAAIREAVGDALCLGAGTVLTVEQVNAAHEAGAAFILSPNTNDEVVRETRRLGMVSVPGAMTPTEIAHAWDVGADIVKLFPADDLGYHYIWNLRGPLPHIPLLASGGVNPETIPLFFAQGIRAVGTGASIVKRDLLEARDWGAITALARRHVDAVQGKNETEEPKCSTK